MLFPSEDTFEFVESFMVSALRNNESIQELFRRPDSIKDASKEDVIAILDEILKIFGNHMSDASTFPWPTVAMLAYIGWLRNIERERKAEKHV